MAEDSPRDLDPHETQEWLEALSDVPETGVPDVRVEEGGEMVFA